MRICIAQIRLRAMAPEENFQRIEAAVSKASHDQADLIVLPEMAIPGYFIGDAWERTSFVRQCEEFNDRLAALSANIPIIFGSVGVDRSARNEDGRVRKYNAAFIAQNGRLLINSNVNLPFWPKTLMPNYREFDDSRHFFDLRKLCVERNQPLQSMLKLIPLKLARGQVIQLALGICEDAWSEDYSIRPYDIMCSHGTRPDLLVNLSCSPFTIGKQQRREKLFSQMSSKFGCPVVYVNAVGTQNNGKTVFSFDGDSGIYSQQGFSGIASAFEPATQTIALSKNGPTVSGSAHTSLTPSSRMREIHLAVEASLKFIKEEWNLEKIAIGVSGGIDSALSAVIHTRVFGAKNVFCVNMPSQFNSPQTIQAAQLLAQNLGCGFASLGIEESVKLTINQLNLARNQGLPLNDPLPNLVKENLQARDRGSRILAGVASALGAVFPCNANKSELTVGYSTLYGDHAGYLAPIADLWKGDVYALAEYYNLTVFGADIIPKVSLTVVPSAELSAEQDVSQGKGDPFCYPYHDALFKLWVEEWNRYDFESTLAAWDNGTLSVLLGAEASQHLQRLFKTRDEFRADLKRWWTAYTGMGAFKRVQAPPVLALTRRAFGFDHREFVGVPSSR